MEESMNMLCECRQQKSLDCFYEELKQLLQDSDALEEKKKVQDSLKNMAENITYFMLGEEGAGKSSLLHALFFNILPEEEMSESICEYRWGEEDAAVSLADGFEKRFVNNENIRGLSIIDTKGPQIMSAGAMKKVTEIAGKCDVLLAVFDAKCVERGKVWDIIASQPQKKILFFLTKCDLYSLDEIQESREKLECYGKEAGILPTVFPVSVKGEENSLEIAPLDEVRSYIRKQVVGENPILMRQKKNVEEMNGILEELQCSFLLRKQQYEEDIAILHKINHAMDGYVENQETIVQSFTKELTGEINSAIDRYQKEIISKMDPYKIKERFQTKEDFTDYLNMVNENYRNMMTDSVNRKTVEVIKRCLHDLEIVFKEAVGYFNQRENILALNDRFYGSMSKSHKEMIAGTRETSLAAGEFYKTLSEASDDLFLQIWQEREKYDKSIRNRKTYSDVGGGAVGGLIGRLIAARVLDSGILAVLGTAGLVGVGVILGAAKINKIAKTLYDPKAAAKMEKAAEESIQMFRNEVENTRKVMAERVMEQITSIFQKEVQNADECFTEFRMSVNIEERKLPFLEEILKTSMETMEEIKALERKQQENEQ
ncbi:MAG: GTPase domain-containing protein [Clostridium sp.]|nr:GTPase domain-containing protein [Clostridium sp.]